MLKEEITKLLKEKTNNNEFSGVVLIKRGEEEIYAGAYGYANRGWDIKSTLQTRFRIAQYQKCLQQYQFCN